LEFRRKGECTMSGYEMVFKPAGVELDLGKGNGVLRIMAGELTSVSVDVGMSDAKICVVRHSRGENIVNIRTIENLSSADISNMLYDLIKVGKPEKLYLDYQGAGVLIKDTLLPLLKKDNCFLAKNGDLIYSLDEMYNRLQ